MEERKLVNLDLEGRSEFVAGFSPQKRRRDSRGTTGPRVIRNGRGPGFSSRKGPDLNGAGTLVGSNP